MMADVVRDKGKTCVYELELSRETDMDIITCPDGRESFQGYLKHLVREDLLRRSPGDSLLKAREMEKGHNALPEIIRESAS